jgi:glucose/arabinose dehydrogenase
MKTPWPSISKLLLVLLAILLVLLLAIWLIGPQRLQSLFHQELADAPAPTTVPLPTLSTSEGSVSTPKPDSLPTFTPVSPTPTPPDVHTPMPTVDIVPTRIVPPSETINLPPGFGISIFSAMLSSPRMMALGPDKQLYVADRGAGRIVRLPDRDGDGVADGVEPVAEGLSAPSSIAFYKDGSLYVGETTRVLRLSAPDGNGVFMEREVIVDGLPSGGHNTRTVLFSPDWSKLFVSIGSSCNVCIEEDERRATIMRYDPDGSAEEVFARGLRNAVGITFRPGTDELWATNNGRDWLGDDLPPETVYIVREGDDAGWPYCHSGRIVDPDFGEADACNGISTPAVEMQAHSAPLGLTFYTGHQFPEEYQGDLFVAFHGSWNRTKPTGYKVVRIPMRDRSHGSVQDFAAGWLLESGSNWGRPVDVLTAADGSLFVSDDSSGVVYRIFYIGE